MTQNAGESKLVSVYIPPIWIGEEEMNRLAVQDALQKLYRIYPVKDEYMYGVAQDVEMAVIKVVDGIPLVFMNRRTFLNCTTELQRRTILQYGPGEHDKHKVEGRNWNLYAGFSLGPDVSSLKSDGEAYMVYFDSDGQWDYSNENISAKISEVNGENSQKIQDFEEKARLSVQEILEVVGFKPGILDYSEVEEAIAERYGGRQY